MTDPDRPVLGVATAVAAGLAVPGLLGDPVGPGSTDVYYLPGTGVGMGDVRASEAPDLPRGPFVGVAAALGGVPMGVGRLPGVEGVALAGSVTLGGALSAVGLALFPVGVLSPALHPAFEDDATPEG